MANELRKRWSVALDVKGMQIKTTMIYMPTIINTIKKEVIANIGEDVEKLQPSYIAGEM